VGHQPLSLEIIVKDLLDQSKWLALDTETTGSDLFHGAKPFMVAVCSLDDYQCWEWNVNPYTREPIIPIGDICKIRKSIRDKVLIFHNAKFDIRALSNIGIDIQRTGILDTQIASHVCDSLEPHQLKRLAKKYLGIDDKDEKTLLETVRAARRVAYSRKWSTGRKLNGKESVYADYWMPRIINPHNDICRQYCITDVIRTIKLMQMYAEVLESEGLWEPFFREMKLLPIVYDMETQGISISLEEIGRQLHEYQVISDREETCCRSIRRINIRSTQQLQEILYSKSGSCNIFPTPSCFHLSAPFLTKSGKPSTSVDALKYLKENSLGAAKEFVSHLLAYRSRQSGIRYLKGYLQSEINGVLHPSFHQTGTRTTRFSSSDPNAQNVSKHADLPLRKVFCPKPGYCWVSIDYSQMELRLFAYISGEKSLIKSFEEGYDFHGFVASRISGKDPSEVTSEERRIAKNTNFAIIFGASPWKVDHTAGVKGAYDLFAAQFPNVEEFLNRTIALVNEQGFITTLGGYRLRVPLQDPYKGVSYVVQGSAGDIIKNAMIDMYWSGILDELGCDLIIMVHDELVFQFPDVWKEDIEEAPTEVQELQFMMEEAGRKLGVVTPTEAKLIKHNWSEGIPLL